MPTPMRKVYVVGCGLSKFEKPGRRQDIDYPDFSLEACTRALLDANLTYDDVEFASVGYLFGDSTCGQRSLYQLGLTQIPIVNCSNNGATGATSLYVARLAVASGQVDCAMALGFDKMSPGSLSASWEDRTQPLDKIIEQMIELRGLDPAPILTQVFGNAGVEYMEKYGGSPDCFDVIASKSHTHSQLNPYAQFRQPCTPAQAKSARKIFGPLTILHCSANSDGAACAILCSEDFVIKHGLGPQAVEIKAQALATDSTLAFDPEEKRKSCIEIAGADMTRRAAREAYAKAGIKAGDLDVIELHDCFSTNEVCFQLTLQVTSQPLTPDLSPPKLISYDALGLCEPGKAADYASSGATFHPRFWSGPKPPYKNIVVNTSGGLQSKGHPISATGVAQCNEVTWQLRGWCGDRQVPDARLGLQHTIGLGGAVVVSVFGKAEGLPTPKGYKAPWERIGYNAAVEYREINEEDIRKVMSRTGSLAGTRERLKPEYAEKWAKGRTDGLSGRSRL
ncbi:hypothetical protein HK101_007876 [Irineochytrium annulatum]|nr:hypothetical protein HK101_007876 [Irineochytrium annulatum]